ncbi:bifunctional folylpolyglutamate synthase/dihydrofolate synthase [Allorhodopirellula solitaria]|uniref:Dihydrofolate synthase/folylpolyglutamate synthase n=1 Tax=Allorhodopirellula solitaria TaxID=2527987 RepID=A0A5C5YKD5_9BACT|nr:folylpolyglutamate synthase/dihydrofolate synthase family protein [Allorhodopirellula solitaria]TWT75360.1 Folylpolyglutamate synthase [Allorhodopirellula solitaria]
MPPTHTAACDSAADDPTAYDRDAYEAATTWLYDRIDYERLARSGSRYRFTLDRMRDLVSRLGHANSLAQPSQGAGQPSHPPGPGRATGDAAATTKIVHIAGTKGKGSVATMTAAMLAAAGHQVGLYTSPHLVDLEERFRVNGRPATRRQMTDLIDSMRPIVEAMSRASIGGPSFFELTTAIAIEHFHRCRCDYWVLETGLGGRLDSTNVFQSDVTLLTSIGLDHQHVLGDTLELIAREKAGILKPGVPAVSGVTKSPARETIRQAANEVGAPLLELGRDFHAENIVENASAQIAGPCPWGSSFDWVSATADGETPATARVSLQIEGRHQIGNAAVALQGLQRLGAATSPEVLRALAGVQIEARLERFTSPAGPTVVLDAAHNADSITALAETLESRFTGRRIVGVFGTSVDKDASAMLELLGPCLDGIVLTRYHGNPRFVPVDQLAEMAGKTRAGGAAGAAAVTTCEDPVAACQAAIDEAGQDGVVVICGSFFLAAEVRPWLLAQRT